MPSLLQHGAQATDATTLISRVLWILTMGTAVVRYLVILLLRHSRGTIAELYHGLIEVIRRMLIRRLQSRS